jgi:hypothetical protein
MNIGKSSITQNNNGTTNTANSTVLEIIAQDDARPTKASRKYVLRNEQETTIETVMTATTEMTDLEGVIVTKDETEGRKIKTIKITTREGMVIIEILPHPGMTDIRHITETEMEGEKTSDETLEIFHHH